MPDENKGGDNPGGGAAPEGQDPSKNPAPGAQDDKNLESADSKTLVGLIRDLRKENGDHRTANNQLKEQLDQVSKKLTALEDSSKTEDQKKADAIRALEADAAKVPGLTKYHDFVKAELDEEMKRIGKLKAEEKAPYTSALGTLAEDDVLGRLNIVRALKAAAGTRVADGDEGNPLQPGGGEKKPTMSQQLAWSPHGLEEARIAGMVEKS